MVERVQATVYRTNSNRRFFTLHAACLREAKDAVFKKYGKPEEQNEWDKFYLPRIKRLTKLLARRYRARASEVR